MLARSLLKLPNDLDVNKINGLMWERETNTQQLKSVIQFDNHSFSVSDMKVFQATAYHERCIDREKLIQDGRKYKIVLQGEKYVTKANCHFTKGLGLVGTLDHRKFVLEILRQGYRSIIPPVEYSIDTAKLANDHSNQWIHNFSGRKGRVDSGVVYGDGVERDTIFGPELGSADVGTIGWVTDFFNDFTKVRVSPKGSVIIMGEIDMDSFFSFILNEIMPYVDH